MMIKKIVSVLLAGLCLMSSGWAAPVLHSFEPDSMAQLVASQKGKPFVLVIWSLECTYCQASLATLAQEKRIHPGLAVVTLAIDTLEYPQVVQRIGKKLDATGIKGCAWAFGAAPADQLRYVIDAKWHGEMPRSYWFNKQGEKVAYSGLITAATIDKLFARP
jgi:thiol-disulfide isomerase/thioredoxin